ncbi:POT family [Musa troglodytarum]|uniref:POT family n=1 Tax=Musa troglodytarum TaxID=320322 RepID=A0A9E7F8K3_9LILI|nr:POT family [Musa troglodytarum]
MVVLTLTAAVPQLRPPVAEQSGQPLGPSGAHLAILFLSLGLLVLGAGGVRPCSLPFGVDQFDRSTEQGRRGLNSFFNWYYSISTAATVVAMTAVVYIQDSVSWPLGFGIPTALMLLAIILFFAGIRLYVFVPPDDPWKLCSVQQIEEVKCLMRIAPIWASGIICFVALTQQWTLAALQSMKMDRHLGPSFQIPPGSLGTICLMAIVLFIPLYDQILVPMATSITGVEGGITLLQRQGAGMAIAIMSMVVAGLVEKKRRDSALAHGGADGTSPLSAMWLAPQLCLMGVAEAFNAVGQVEFYNRQFPEHMQTLAGSLFHCSLAGASYLSSFLIAFVRKSTGGPGGASWLDDDINVGRVDYYYYLIAALGVGNLLYFMVCAHLYRYKGTPELEDVCKDIKAVF